MNFKTYYEESWRYEGMSALTIFGVHDGDNVNGCNYPHDPDDLTRCFQCLRKITNSEDVQLWKKAIEKVVKRYPDCMEWKSIYDNFDKLFNSYFQEYEFCSMPKTYKLMKELEQSHEHITIPEEEMLNGICEDAEHEICFTLEQWQDMNKNNIDKRKVKEAIEKVFSKGPRSWRATKRYIELKKELNLE